MDATTRRFLTKTLMDNKVPLKIKKRLIQKHGDKPELAQIISRTGIDQQEWYKKMSRKESLKEAIKEELSTKRERQLRTTKGEVAHQMLYTTKHPFKGEKADQQRRIIAKINKRLGV